MKLLVVERKVRKYTELDSSLCTELLISKGELQSLLLYLIYVPKNHMDMNNKKVNKNSDDSA